MAGPGGAHLPCGLERLGGRVSTLKAFPVMLQHSDGLRQSSVAERRFLVGRDGQARRTQRLRSGVLQTSPAGPGGPALPSRRTGSLRSRTSLKSAVSPVVRSYPGCEEFHAKAEEKGAGNREQET